MSGRPAITSTDAVVAAALAIAQTSGLRAVTLRSVGGVVGVHAMSLYTYVSSKDDLLDQMLRATCGDQTADTLDSPNQRVHPADADLVAAVRDTLIGLAVVRSEELAEVVRLVLASAGTGEVHA